MIYARIKNPRKTSKLVQQRKQFNNLRHVAENKTIWWKKKKAIILCNSFNS